MIEGEARQYFKRLGREYNQQRAISVDEARDNLHSARVGVDWNIALFESLCLSANPQYASIFASRGNLRTTEDSLHKALRGKVRRMDESQRKQWNAANERMNRYIRMTAHAPALSELREAGLISTMEAVHEYMQWGAYAYRYLYQSARDVLVFDALQQQKQLSTKNNLGEEAQQYFLFREFNGFSPLSLSVDGTSLADLFKDDFKLKKGLIHKNLAKYIKLVNKLSPLSTLVDQAALMDIKDEDLDYDYDSSIEDLPDEITLSDGTIMKLEKDPTVLYKNDYLVDLRINQEDISHMLAFFDPRITIDGLRNARGKVKVHGVDRPTEERIYQTACSMLRTVAEFRQQVRAALTNPEFEGSEEIRNLFRRKMEFYNSRDIFNLIMDSQGLIPFYRQISALANGNNDPGFYKSLAHEIEQQIEIRRLDIPTSDDLELIRDNNVVIESPEQENLAALKPQVDRATSIALWRKFTLTPDMLPWETIGIIPPSEIAIAFGNTPYEISITTQHKTNDEETIKLLVRADARKLAFDWRVSDAPDQQIDMKARCFRLITATLSEIERQAREKQQKQSAQTVVITPASTPRRKGEYIPREKPAKEEKGMVQLLAEAADITYPQPEKRVKESVITPDETEYDRIFREASIGDTIIQRRIKTRINQLNGMGAGFVKALGQKGDEGQREYSFRIGKYRVILVEGKFEKGSRAYKIDRIGNRAIVY